MIKKMKKRGVTLLSLAMALLCVLTACGQNNADMIPPQQSTLPPLKPAETILSASPDSGTEDDAMQELGKPNFPIGAEDTYWTAYEWYSADGEGAEGPHPMIADEWCVDLLIRSDGTARFRDIHDSLYLMDDADLSLVWEREDDGRLSFYNETYLLPSFWGIWEIELPDSYSIPAQVAI